MRRQLINLFCLLVISCILLSINSFAYDKEFVFRGEPDGFRGFKWGTAILAFKDLKHVGRLESDDTELYEKENDVLHIESAKLKFVRYGFWKGKFWMVTAKVKSPQDWEVLKQSCIGEFGRGKEVEGNVFWYGKITKAYLQKYLASLSGEMPSGEKFTLLAGEFSMFSQEIGDYKNKLETQKFMEDMKRKRGW